MNTPLLSSTWSTCNTPPVTLLPDAAISACTHGLGALLTQLCLFTNTHTASQFEGPVVTCQLLSHLIVKVIVLPLTDGVPIIKLLANENFIYRKISEIENSFKNLKIISYKTDGVWSVEVDPLYKIKQDDLLVFLGEAKYIKEFYKQL